MRARYLGPVIVISRNRGGAYILTELDGSMLNRPVAVFRVIPYFVRSKLDLPSLETLIDISQAHLTQMEESKAVDPEDDNAKDLDDENPLKDD
jgi:hypothetical protein